MQSASDSGDLTQKQARQSITWSHTPKERPILFSGPMVRALLAGRKTVTRRVVKHRHPISFIGGQGEQDDPACWGYFFDGPDHNGYAVLARGLNEREDHGRISIPCPYGEPGDRLWVKETVRWNKALERGQFAADGALSVIDNWGWRRPVLPSIHMPRGVCRIRLEVADVRVERLHDITDDEVEAEGVELSPDGFSAYYDDPNGHQGGILPSPRAAFEHLWTMINGAESWAENPWVWRVGFRPLLSNTIGEEPK